MLASGPALAGEGRVEERPIIVTGSPLAAPAGDASLSNTSIEGERLASAGTERLESVLGDVAGFQMFRRSDSRSSHPTAQGAGLRSLGGNASSRALVVLDGVPLEDPFGGWIGWNMVDPGSLGAVRITKGGGISHYGAGALTGAIVMDSEPTTSAAVGNADVALGSRNSMSVRGAYASNVGQAAVQLWARYDRGDGFTPIREPIKGMADRPAPYQQFSARARLVFAAGENGEIQVGAVHLDDRRDRGYDFSDSLTRGHDFSVRYIAKGAWPLEVMAYAKRRNFYTQFAAVPDDRSIARQVLDQRTPSTGYGIKGEIRPRWGRFDARFGGDWSLRDGTTYELFSYVGDVATRSRTAGGVSENAALFAGLDWHITPHFLATAETRLDRWTLRDGQWREAPLAGGPVLVDRMFPDRGEWHWSGRGGMAWQATPSLTLRTSGYRSVRLPTLNELFRPFRVGADGTAANPFLSPEHLIGAEIGADWLAGSVIRFSMTGFWNRLQDAITNVTIAKSGNQCPGVGFVSGLCRERQNITAVRTYGVELDARYAHGPWRLSSSYALGDAHVEAAATTGINGKRPAQTPRHQASGRVEWKGANGATIALLGRYQSARFEDDQQSIRLRPAFTMDAQTNVPIKAGLDVGVRVENLFNRVVEVAKNAGDTTERASPRTVWLTLRLR